MTHKDAFAAYTETLADPRYTPLDAKTERQLMLQYHKTKDEAAFNKLVDGNLRYVVFFVTRAYKLPPSIDLMDMIQVGNEGLLEGVKKFNPVYYRCRVFTYCTYWMRANIKTFLRTQDRALARRVAEEASQLSEKIFSTLAGDGDLWEPQRDMEQFRKEILRHASEVLNEQERFIILQYYGFNPSEQAKTLQELGSILHLTFERVRQIKKKAFHKLKLSMPDDPEDEE